MRYALYLPTITRAACAFLLPLAAGALLAGAANAVEVFRWTDSAGKIHYGDKPTGGAQATRLEVQTTPITQSVAEATTATTVVHDGGYSDTLNTCLQNGGTNADCVAMASAAHTDKAAAERVRAEAIRESSRPLPDQQSTQAPQSTQSGAQETALRAAALAAERARQQRDRRDRDSRLN